MFNKLALATYNNPQRKTMFESFAEERGHYVFVEIKNQDHRAFCSCGWTDMASWSGVALAWVEWRTHVINQSVQVSTPNDGEDLKGP